MIDIDNAKKVFDEFVSNYDRNNTKIDLKYYHTYRVCDKMEELCNSINMTDEEKKLAFLIALFHDLGRFEQVKVYDTFNDKKSLDHSLIAIDFLFSKEMIRDFINDDKYDKLIAKAVYFHNKYEIGECNDEELLYSKLIRDADKLDILYNLAILGGISLDIDDRGISEKVEEDFNNERPVRVKNSKLNNDRIVTMLSFVFDLNFDYSYQYLIDNKIFEELESKINNKNFDKYFKKVKEYINRK